MLKPKHASSILQAAQAKAAAFNVMIDSGGNPFEKAAEKEKEPTFRELFNAYLERHVDKSRKTGADMRQNFDRCMSDLADRKASEITQLDAEKLHGALGVKKPYAANRAVQLARAIYNKAKVFKIYFGENPFQGITLFEETPRERFLTAEEAATLINALDTQPQRYLRVFIHLSLFTGIRKGNILSMCWSDINWQEGTWAIPKTKNGTSQLVPLTGRDVAILDGWRTEPDATGIKSEYVFPGSGKTGHLKQVQKYWTSLRARTGLNDVTIHDLRRSLAATMASENINVALIKSAMNHKDLKTTLTVYARTNKRAELEAKQVAHTVWLHEAGLLHEKDNVTPLRAVE